MLQNKVDVIKLDLTKKEWKKVVDLSKVLEEAFEELNKISRSCKWDDCMKLKDFSYSIVFEGKKYNANKIFRKYLENSIFSEKTDYRLNYHNIYTDPTIWDYKEYEKEESKIFRKLQKRFLDTNLKDKRSLEDYLESNLRDIIVRGKKPSVDFNQVAILFKNYNLAVEKLEKDRRERNKRNNFLTLAHKTLFQGRT